MRLIAALALLTLLSACDDDPAAAPTDVSVDAPDTADAAELDETGDDASPPQPTWTDDVMPIFERVCAGCHGSAGCIAGACFLDDPSVLDQTPASTLCDATTIGGCLLESVHEGTMPPGGCTIGEFDCLDEAEVSLVEAWLAAGAPK